MRPFVYQRADDLRSAARLVSQARPGGQPPTAAPAQFLAGGTTMLDLMKLDVMQPQMLVDIKALKPSLDQPLLDFPLDQIQATPKGLRLGALVRMSQAEQDQALRRDYPVLAESLHLAASAQIRNMATLGGNVLQRTRCTYFRDTRWANCNKRDPGSGCAALEGANRKLAVLGTSEKCIAAYPGDFAQALIALGARVELAGPKGRREIAFGDLHRGSEAPHIETVLEPGELITGFLVPSGAWTKRSLYLKIRDRESYEFALASAAVALQLEDGIVKEARIGLGGVAYRPWRAHAAEAALKGKSLTEDDAKQAASLAFEGAQGRGDNEFKIALGQRTLVRALLQARAMEV